MVGDIEVRFELIRSKGLFVNNQIIFHITDSSFASDSAVKCVPVIPGRSLSVTINKEEN